MKKRIILFFLLIITSVTNTFSRQQTPAEQQQIIAQLDSTEGGKDIVALSNVVKYNIVEAVPLIEEKIWKRWIGDWDVYLKTLLHFKSPNLRAILHTVIDSSEVFGTRPFIDMDGLPMPLTMNPAELRAEATHFLIQLGDYSTAKYAFEAIRLPRSSFGYGRGLTLLKEVAKNVTQYADSAKTELIRIARYSTSTSDRSVTQDRLIELYSKNIFVEIVYWAKNESDPANRITALKALCALDYPDLQALLRDRLTTEPFELYKQDIAESLLVRFGSVENYRIVRNFAASTPERTIKVWLGRVLEDFKPPIPSLSTPVLVLLDSLISYKHQVAALGWLKDKKEDEKGEDDEEEDDEDDTIVKKLDRYLGKARKELLRSDSLKTRHEVEKFVKKVGKLRKESIEAEQKQKPEKMMLTEEGYKFLYYNAKYIVDRLPRKK